MKKVTILMAISSLENKTINVIIKDASDNKNLDKMLLYIIVGMMMVVSNLDNATPIYIIDNVEVFPTELPHSCF